MNNKLETANLIVGIASGIAGLAFTVYQFIVVAKANAEAKRQAALLEKQVAENDPIN